MKYQYILLSVIFVILTGCASYEKNSVDKYKNLKETIKKINPSGLLPFNFYLFGGTAQLPEIQKILEQGDWQDINFTEEVQVKLFSLKDYYNYFNLQKESLSSIFLNNPQYVPSFLIFYARKNL